MKIGFECNNFMAKAAGNIVMVANDCISMEES